MCPSPHLSIPPAFRRNKCHFITASSCKSGQRTKKDCPVCRVVEAGDEELFDSDDPDFVLFWKWTILKVMIYTDTQKGAYTE